MVQMILSFPWCSRRCVSVPNTEQPQEVQPQQAQPQQAQSQLQKVSLPFDGLTTQAILAKAVRGGDAMYLQLEYPPRNYTVVATPLEPVVEEPVVVEPVVVEPVVVEPLPLQEPKPLSPRDIYKSKLWPSPRPVNFVKHLKVFSYTGRLTHKKALELLAADAKVTVTELLAMNPITYLEKVRGFSEKQIVAFHPLYSTRSRLYEYLFNLVVKN